MFVTRQQDRLLEFTALCCHQHYLTASNSSVFNSNVQNSTFFSFIYLFFMQIKSDKG